MLIIGCDLHPRYQQIARLDTETGEIVERRLEHENGEARGFYVSLSAGARVGIEATVQAQWFEHRLMECGHELGVGDAAPIRAMGVRHQRTDVREAVHLMKLMVTNRFPRIWIPSPEERDGRHLRSHRQKLVGIRTGCRLARPLCDGALPTRRNKANLNSLVQGRGDSSKHGERVTTVVGILKAADD